MKRTGKSTPSKHEELGELEEEEVDEQDRSQEEEENEEEEAGTVDLLLHFDKEFRKAVRFAHELEDLGYGDFDISLQVTSRPVHEVMDPWRNDPPMLRALANIIDTILKFDEERQSSAAAKCRRS